jgi:phosphate-selective porin OprO and OprP
MFIRAAGPAPSSGFLPLLRLLPAIFLAGIPGPGLLSAQAPPDDGDPRAGWEDGSFFFESGDGRFRMTLGGRVQPRYQLRDPVAGESTSSFLLRRLRLDLRGTVLDERLAFRIQPELARTANLRDGWLEWAFRPDVRIRAGQQVAPFHWHRFVSGNRHHFAERSRPSETFGFPNGYDVGVSLHGQDRDGRFAWGVGLFDGAGRNVAESNSSGNMVSARVTRAVLGSLPREEPDLARSEELQLSLGAGLQGATRNEVRDWDLGRSATANERGDWVAVTGDVHLRFRGLSLVGEGYRRRVTPDDPAVDSYSGWAWGAGTGYFLVPGRVELVGRASDMRLDRRDPDTRERQWGAGVNHYLHGHLLKAHLQFFRTTTTAGREDILLVQLHLLY